MEAVPSAPLEGEPAVTAFVGKYNDKKEKLRSKKERSRNKSKKRLTAVFFVTYHTSLKIRPLRLHCKRS